MTLLLIYLVPPRKRSNAKIPWHSVLFVSFGLKIVGDATLTFFKLNNKLLNQKRILNCYYYFTTFFYNDKKVVFCVFKETFFESKNFCYQFWSVQSEFSVKTGLIDKNQTNLCAHFYFRRPSSFLSVLSASRRENISNVALCVRIFSLKKSPKIFAFSSFFGAFLL